MNKKLLIIGQGTAGKDVAAEQISLFSGLRFCHGTSWYARDWMVRKYPHLGLDAESAWKDRRNHRQLWAEEYAQYHRAFYLECLKENDILSGMRRENEFVWLRDHLIGEGYQVMTLFIARDVKDETFELCSVHADIIVENYGTLAEFQNKVLTLGAFIK